MTLFLVGLAGATVVTWKVDRGNLLGVYTPALGRHSSSILVSEVHESSPAPSARLSRRSSHGHWHFNCSPKCHQLTLLRSRARG